jgi:hypothetical protein
LGTRSCPLAEAMACLSGGAKVVELVSPDGLLEVEVGGRL